VRYELIDGLAYLMAPVPTVRHVSSKNPMIKINNNFYLTIAVAVSIGIFFVAGRISGTLNSTGLHWIAHIAAYAFLGACYAKGLPRSTVVMVTLLTAGIGGLHELYEVGRFGIALELRDLFYDIVGAFAGALLVRQLLVLAATRER
jgi:hypothetical protein